MPSPNAHTTQRASQHSNTIHTTSAYQPVHQAEVAQDDAGADAYDTEGENNADQSSAIPASARPIQPALTSAIRNGAASNPAAATSEPQAPAYSDEDRVCVSFGYGANDLTSQRFFVGDIMFSKNRIARGVPYAKAKALQKVYPSGVLRIHENDASDAEIARACGIRPDAPAKVAAMLLASDLDAIAAQMKPDDLERLAIALRNRAAQQLQG